MEKKKQTILRINPNIKFKLSVEECPFYQKRGICEDTGKKCSDSMNTECKEQFHSIDTENKA